MVSSRLEPLILTDATPEGFFGSGDAARAMRLLGNVAARRVLVHELMLPTSLSDVPEVPRALVLRIEVLRQAIIQDVVALKAPISLDKKSCVKGLREGLVDCEKWYYIGVVAAPRVGGTGPMD